MYGHHKIYMEVIILFNNFDGLWDLLGGFYPRFAFCAFLYFLVHF